MACGAFGLASVDELPGFVVVEVDVLRDAECLERLGSLVRLVVRVSTAGDERDSDDREHDADDLQPTVHDSILLDFVCLVVWSQRQGWGRIGDRGHGDPSDVRNRRAQGAEWPLGNDDSGSATGSRRRPVGSSRALQSRSGPKLVAEVRVRDRDERLGPFAQAASEELGHAVLGHDGPDVRARRDDAGPFRRASA